MRVESFMDASLAVTPELLTQHGSCFRELPDPPPILRRQRISRHHPGSAHGDDIRQGRRVGFQPTAMKLEPL